MSTITGLRYQNMENLQKADPHPLIGTNKREKIVVTSATEQKQRYWAPDGEEIWFYCNPKPNVPFEGRAKRRSDGRIWFFKSDVSCADAFDNLAKKIPNSYDLYLSRKKFTSWKNWNCPKYEYFQPHSQI